MNIKIKDFSIEATALYSNNDDLEDIICNRQTQFMKTAEYMEIQNRVMAALESIELGTCEDSKSTIRGLSNDILTLECMNYSSAYRAGIADLMTALTFNKLQITKAEYLVAKGA